VPPEQKPPEWWGVRFFKRHKDDDPSEACPGLDFLRAEGAPPG
jgi:hypothetical protein